MNNIRVLHKIKINAILHNRHRKLFKTNIQRTCTIKNNLWLGNHFIPTTKSSTTLRLSFVHSDMVFICYSDLKQKVQTLSSDSFDRFDLIRLSGLTFRLSPIFFRALSYIDIFWWPIQKHMLSDGRS